MFDKSCTEVVVAVRFGRRRDVNQKRRHLFRFGSVFHLQGTQCPTHSVIVIPVDEKRHIHIKPSLYSHSFQRPLLSYIALVKVFSISKTSIKLLKLIGNLIFSSRINTGKVKISKFDIKV